MRTRISVDATAPPARIDRRIYGHFVENMARCVYGGILENTKPGRVGGPWELRESVVELTRDLEPPVVRWPGGLYADGYFWRDGVGPPDARPLTMNRYWSRYGSLTRFLDPNLFGTNEFMDFVDRVGTEAYINVNLGTGTAEDAAAWVEYVNGLPSTLEGRRRASYGREEPWDVKLWGIGNEMYGFWAMGHMPGPEYAQRFLQFREAMSGVDPDLTYVAVGADHYFVEEWNREVLEGAGDLIDLLSIHIYLPGPERLLGVAATRATRGASAMYRSIVACPLEFERRLMEADGDIKDVMGADSTMGIALDEWNLWWTVPQLLAPRWTLRDALYVCGMFHVMHRMAERVTMANVAQLVNVLGVLSAKGRRVYRSTMYHAFSMYSRLAGSQRLACTTECDTFETHHLGGIPAMERVPVLDASATLSEEGDRLILFVINRHPEDAVSATVDLEGFAPAGEVEIHCLNGPSEHANNWYGRDETVSVDATATDCGEVLPTYAFPAHSTTALIFRNATKGSGTKWDI